MDELTTTYRSIALSLELEAQGDFTYPTPSFLCLMALLHILLSGLSVCALVLGLLIQ